MSVNKHMINNSTYDMIPNTLARNVFLLPSESEQHEVLHVVSIPIRILVYCRQGSRLFISLVEDLQRVTLQKSPPPRKTQKSVLEHLLCYLFSSNSAICGMCLFLLLSSFRICDI